MPLPTPKQVSTQQYTSQHNMAATPTMGMERFVQEFLEQISTIERAVKAEQLKLEQLKVTRDRLLEKRGVLKGTLASVIAEERHVCERMESETLLESDLAAQLAELSSVVDSDVNHQQPLLDYLNHSIAAVTEKTESVASTLQRMGA